MPYARKGIEGSNPSLTALRQVFDRESFGSELRAELLRPNRLRTLAYNYNLSIKLICMKEDKSKKIQYANDNTESVKRLARMRIPALAIGLTLGIFLSFTTSRF